MYAKLNYEAPKNSSDVLTRSIGLLIDVAIGIIALPVLIWTPRKMTRLWANSFRNAA